MIGFIDNRHIDKGKWDDCIASHKAPLPYAFSWYLDIMTPGWCALSDHDYRSVFPLPAARKARINYIYTPPFLQCLGLFTREKPEPDMVSEFFSFIPDIYRLIDISVHSDPGNVRGRVAKRDNYLLSLNRSYEDIYSDYTSDGRRNVSSAKRKRPVLTEKITPREAIALFLEGPGKKIKGIGRSDYERLEELMRYATEYNKGKIIGVRVHGRLIYSVFMLTTHGRITLLFTSGSEESRKRRTGYFVTDDIISSNAGKKIVLDFAGSSIPSIADYIKSYGASIYNYYRVYSNNLPWPLSILK